MIKKLISIITLAFIFLISCNKHQSDLEFEKSVLKEIFPALLDSVHHDTRLPPPYPPPLPPPKLGEEQNDSSKYKWNKEKWIAEYKKLKSEIEKDTTKLVIAVVDSTYQIENRAKKNFIEFYNEYSIELDENIDNERYKINISNLKHSIKFQLKYYSEFPATIKIWDKEYDFILSGVTWMSRIQFDKTKTFGVLQSGFGCGKLCGFSGIVLIRKLKGKWEIDKIVVYAVS